MNGGWLRWGFVTILFLAWSHLAAEEPTKIQLRPRKGFEVAYTVKRQSRDTGESSRGEWKSESSIEIEYRIHVAERKKHGDLELSVTYGPVKVKRESTRGSWEFDSTSEEAKVDKATAALLESKINVTVSEGRVKEVSGFPEVRRGEGERQGSPLRWIAGQRALQRDLDYILSSQVLGRKLEKGTMYLPEPEKPTGDGGRRRRWRGDPMLAYKFRGLGKIRGIRTAQFTLRDTLAQGEEERPPFQRKDEAKGSARISLKDGMLLELELGSETETKGEWQGQKFESKRKLSLRIERRDPKKAEPKPVSL